MKVNCDDFFITKDEKYYRVNIKIETHTLHSEKLNEDTAKYLIEKYGVNEE